MLDSASCPSGDHGAARPPDHRPNVDYRLTSLAELADAAGAWQVAHNGCGLWG